MTMKITITPEYEDETKTLSLKHVTFVFVAKKKINCFKLIFLTFGGYAPECLNYFVEFNCSITEKFCTNSSMSYTEQKMSNPYVWPIEA